MAVAARMAVPLFAMGLPVLAYLAIKPALHVAVISAATVMFYLHCLVHEQRRDMASALSIVILMPIIAWTLTNPWMLYLVMVVWVPLFARDAGRVVPVYLFSLLLLPGLDMTAVVGSLKLFDLGVHDVLGVGAAAALFCNRGKSRIDWRRDVPTYSVILLIGAALARDTSFSHLLRSTSNLMLDYGLPYYIASRGVRNMDEFRRVLLWLGCGALVLSSLLIYEAMRSWPIYNELYGQYGGILPMVKSRGGMIRAGGPFVEPTSAAMVLALCTIAIWICRSAFRTARHHALILLIAFVGLAAPQSRGAWIGLGFALVLVEIYLGRYRAIVKGGLIATLGFSALFAAALSSPQLSETLGLSGGSSETSEYRRQLFERGMEEYWQSPLLGFSNPELEIRLADLRQGEGIIDYVNSYIWIMLISGAVGLAIFVGAFVHYLRKLIGYRRLPTSDRAGRESAAFIFAGLSMTLEMLFFTSFGTRPAIFTFVLLGFAAALFNLYRRPARYPMSAVIARYAPAVPASGQ
ncbi:O-antigen ligase family protein [Sphingobium lactosutens]|uniref:O-antigen ligase family protein n=1 Tax=Sphingobium lactosutens TaxID=522773 RepID=UPI0015C0490D|nr:O-antigen ligase family protein [Sphingobium lactosutens]